MYYQFICIRKCSRPSISSSFLAIREMCLPLNNIRVVISYFVLWHNFSIPKRYNIKRFIARVKYFSTRELYGATLCDCNKKKNTIIKTHLNRRFKLLRRAVSLDARQMRANAIKKNTTQRLYPKTISRDRTSSRARETWTTENCREKRVSRLRMLSATCTKKRFCSRAKAGTSAKRSCGKTFVTQVKRDTARVLLLFSSYPLVSPPSPLAAKRRNRKMPLKIFDFRRKPASSRLWK